MCEYSARQIQWVECDRCRGGFMVGRGRHLLVPRILRPPADVVVCTSHQFQVFSQVWSAEDVDGQ